MTGKIILDPINFTPAGIVSKGTKAVRIAKSMGLGSLVGAGTSIAKDYGDDTVGEQETRQNMTISAGIVSVLNGVIAGVTKGRVPNAIKNIEDEFPEASSVTDIADGIVKNPKEFGLSEDEASTVAQEYLKKSKPQKASVNLGFEKQTIQNETPIQETKVDADGIVEILPKEIDKDTQGWNKVAEDVLGKSPDTKVDDAVSPLSTKPKLENLEPQQKIKTLEVMANDSLRKANFEQSVDNLDDTAKYKSEAEAYADEAIALEKQLSPAPTNKPSKTIKDLQEHPRYDELIEMRKNISAKESQSPQTTTQAGGVRELDGYGGENKQTYDKASYEKNYNYDFHLTKQDVKKLNNGKYDDDLLTKLETDLGTLDNHPDYAPQTKTMSDTDWKEVNELFAKGADNLAVGTFAGIEEDENGNITFDPEKFVLGLGGYTAVKTALKNKQIQGKLKEYAQKAIDTVDMNPAVYKENGINAMSPVKSKSQKEKRGIYNVQNNEKKSTNIYKDDEFAENIIKYEKGKSDFIDKDGKHKSGFGSLHIDKHLGKDKDGWVSEEELLNIGNAIRNTNPTVSKNGSRVYEYINNDDARFRVIVGDKKNGERTISFFSNRKAGFGNNSQNYIYNQPLHETIIPQTSKNIQANTSHSLAGGFAGGSDSLISQRDYNDDGEYDYKDLLAGVAAGAISINALKKIAPKLFKEESSNAVKIGAFSGEAYKKAKTKGYEHIRKIVSDESLKEWGDASSFFKRNFTDTLSAEYHNLRESVTASTNGESIKIERLHNTLNELSETDRKSLHEFVAGEVESIDKTLEPLAKKMKNDIHKLSSELVDRKVLGEEAFKEWEHHYIHRSYDKHFEANVKALFNKGFKIDEIIKRGRTDILSAKKAKEFTDSVKPEIFKVPLYKGGMRMKRLPNGKYELRRDWTPQERLDMKEITDGAITIPETLMKLKRMRDNAQFLEDIIKIDDVVLEDASLFTVEELSSIGYEIAPKNMKYGVLAGKAIRKDVLNDIKGINDEIFNTFGDDGALARVWKGYLSTWKKSKTVWNMPSHVNNFMSNAFLMHLAGMNSVEITTSIGKAGKMMIHGNAYEELLKKKMIGKATKKNLEDLAQMGEDLKYFIEAKEGGLLGRSQLNDILAGQQNYLAKSSMLARADKFAQDAYQNGDVINRIAMYSHLREKLSLEPDEARKMVLSVMPDYSKPMPKGYRVLRDTGVSPFISWSYYTVPTIYKLLKTKQGSVQMLKAMGALSAMEWVLTQGEITPLIMFHLWILKNLKTLREEDLQYGKMVMR